MTTTTEITEDDYTAAIEKLDEVYGSAEGIIGIIEMARDEEAIHFVDEVTGECIDACNGCLRSRAS